MLRWVLIPIAKAPWSEDPVLVCPCTEATSDAEVGRWLDGNTTQRPHAHRKPLLFRLSSVSAVINNNLPALNYDFHVCQVGNVRDRIPINDDDVGKFAGPQRADLVTEVQVNCRVVG